LSTPFFRIALLWAFVLLLFGLPVKADENAAKQAEAHADRGLELAQAGDLKAAEAELRLAITLLPDAADYLGALGGVLAMQQRLDEASRYFEKSLKIDPGNLTVRRNLATAQWQMGRLREAAGNLNRILKAKPHDPPTVLLLGMVAENSKSYAAAAELLGSVPELVSQRPEAIAALARSYYQNDQKQKARDTLESFLRQSTEPQDAYLGGQIASEAGDAETALKLFGSVQSTYQDQQRLGYQIALAHYRAGHFSETERGLLDLVNDGHPTIEIYNLLAWAYYRQEKFGETIHAMNHAIALDRAKESNYLDFGQMLVDRQQLALAHEVAQKAVENIPGSFHCYMLKGRIEAKQGAFLEAEATYRRAAELNPSAPEAAYNLARMQWLSGKDTQAEKSFDLAIRRFPQDAPTFVEYAQMLLKHAEKGDAQAEVRAISLLKQAVTLDKLFGEPHYQLGNLWLRKGRTTEALEEFKISARLNPSEPKTHFALSRVYRRLGRTEAEAAELATYDKLKTQGKKPD